MNAPEFFSACGASRTSEMGRANTFASYLLCYVFMLARGDIPCCGRYEKIGRGDKYLELSMHHYQAL